MGVVGDVRNRGLHREFLPQVYSFLVPGAVLSPVSFTVYLKARGNPWALAPGLRAAIREADGEAAVSLVQTMEEATERSVQNRSAVTSLFLEFGSLGLVLVGVGFYGLVAYLVAQKRRDCGIRVALGATGSRIVREVLPYGLAPTAVGVGLGAATSLALDRFLASQLFQVTASDPVSMALSALTLCAVVVAAAATPALRAARVSPVVALRND